MEHTAQVVGQLSRMGSLDHISRAETPSFAEINTTVSRVLVVLLGLFLPISTSATEVLLALLAVCWLLSGEFRSKWTCVRQHGLALLLLAFFGFGVAALSYSSAPPTEAIAGLLHYRKVLYVPLLLHVFADARTRELTIRAFCAAMLLTLTFSYLLSINETDVTAAVHSGHAVFKNYITQNILMAFFAFLVAQRMLQTRRHRWPYVVVLILAVFNILFMVWGRTGYLVLAVLFVLLMWQRWKIRGLAHSSVALLLVAASAYFVSSNFRHRIDAVANEWTGYRQQQALGETVPGAAMRSVGLRLQFYENSLAIARKSPLWGTGSGSFVHEYQKISHAKGIPATANPHSEFLLIFVQTGLIGLGLFIAVLGGQWLLSYQLPNEFRNMAQGLCLMMAVGCLANSLLLDTTEGTFYCCWTALCLATRANPSVDADSLSIA